MSTRATPFSPTEAVNRDGGGAVLLAEARKAQAQPTGNDKPFAILRYAKLRSARSITGSAQHMTRAHPTPNANAARTNSNEILIGTADPAADVLRLLPEENARDTSGRLLRRSNSVLAVEVLLTTSPDWWKTATPEQQADWVKCSREALEREWGAENVAHLRMHRDETTPHLTGLIVPLDERGGLNARAWIGGRASKKDPGSSLLSGHQTRYAAAVEHLGLRRGIIGSTARHTTIQEHYRALAKAKEAATPQIEAPPIFGREKWAQDINKTLAQKTAVLAHAAAELPIERQRRIAAERTAELSNQRSEAAKAAQKAFSDQMRAIPLPDVLTALGLEKDAKDGGMWKAGEKGARSHRITIKDGKWFDHVSQRGRGGAIDLVQHVLETDFKNALAWLGHQFGSSAAAADYRGKIHAVAERMVERLVEERAPFTPPQPDPSSWPEVRRHLIEERAIPADLVDAGHATGDIYAVSRPSRGTMKLRNAVFVQRDNSGTPVGAELKGIVRGIDGKHWSGLAPGSRKSAGVFKVGSDMLASAHVFVVESAIDALSLAARIKDHVRGTWAVISSAGDSTMPESILGEIHPHAKRYASQDRNVAGDRQAARLGDGWRRLTVEPPFEDWNEELVARRSGSSGERPSPPPFSTPSP